MPEKYIETELEIEQKQYKKYSEILQLSVIELFKKFNVKLSGKEAESFSDLIYFWPPFPETKTVLKKLKEKHKLVILSNIDDKIIKKSIELINIDFDGVITAEQIKSYKPSFGHWKKMLEVFEIPKKQVLHVGASYIHDVVPAKKLGFTTVWINRNKEKIKGKIKPEFEFTDLLPLLDF